jgi:hypothetical protein
MSPLRNVRTSIHHGVLLARPRLRPALISVRATAPGDWHVTSRDGRLGGTFTSRESALRCARDAAIAVPRAVVVIFEVTGLATCETYEGHACVRVSAIPPTQGRAA